MSYLALALVRCFNRLDRSVATALAVVDDDDDDDDDDPTLPLAAPPAVALLPELGAVNRGWRGSGAWPFTITWRTNEQ